MPTITAWRIYKPRHAPTAFTGDGARLHGGRFNSKGTPLIYTAGSISLAALEILAHLQSSDILLKYLIRGATFDDSLVTTLTPADLPPTWRTSPSPTVLQRIGDAWAKAANQPSQRTPSVGGGERAFGAAEQEAPQKPHRATRSSPQPPRPTPVLQVPSALIESESNYLLNPAHPDFQRITLGPERPFTFDPRLKA